MKTILFSLLFALAGCASNHERTIRYRVPQFEYEQHQPEFTHDPLQ